MLNSLELISKLTESLNSSDITKEDSNYNNQISASRERLNSIATKRSREEQEEQDINNKLNEQHQMPLICIRKPKKSRFFADAAFTAISESTVTLPDNWNTLNSKINNNKNNSNFSNSNNNSSNIPNSKKQKQEKGSNYNDRMKTKINSKKIKTQKKSKQKNSN